MDKVLSSLRNEIESTITVDGAEWGVVYLDNAIPSGISANQFAGFLSALKKTGLYMPIPEDSCFGLVKP